MEEYDSPMLKQLFEEMKHDKWYVKLSRWWRVKWWFIRCDLRPFFEWIIKNK